MSAIDLTPAQTRAFLADARRDFVAQMVRQNQDEFNLLSPSQVAGLLDVNAKSLFELGIPRVELAPKLIRYRAEDLRAYLKKHTFHPGRSA